MAATTETKVTLDFGSPEISGVDCNDLVSKNLTDSDFPLEIEVTSCVGFKTHITGIGFLGESHSDTAVKKLTVKSIDDMQRLASDIESIASVNKRAVLVKVSFSIQDAVVDPVTENDPVTTPVSAKAKTK